MDPSSRRQTRKILGILSPGGPSSARALRALRASDAPRPRRPARRLSASASLRSCGWHTRAPSHHVTLPHSLTPSLPHSLTPSLRLSGAAALPGGDLVVEALGE